MSDTEKEPVSEDLSRKSSASSSTGSSFEKLDRPNSENENKETVADTHEDEAEEHSSEENEEEPAEEAQEVDPLDAPMKPEQMQFYTYKDKVNAIRNLIMFSAAMFTLPLLTMFSMYHYVFIDHYHLPPDKAMLYAAFFGIAVVFAIIILFIYTAYKEEVEAEKRVKAEKKDS